MRSVCSTESLRMGVTVNGTPVDIVSMGRVGSRSATGAPMASATACAIMLRHEFRIHLRHLSKRRSPRGFLEANRYRADVQLKPNLGRCAGTTQHERRSESRVSGEGQLFLDRKDADASRLVAVRLHVSRQNKCRFRQIRFPSDVLHLFGC